MKIEKEYLQSLTIGQLLVFFPDNDSLMHDSGHWNIIYDGQDAISHYNEDLRTLLIDYISEHEFTDGIEIACRKDTALRIKEGIIK